MACGADGGGGRGWAGFVSAWWAMSWVDDDDADSGLWAIAGGREFEIAVAGHIVVCVLDDIFRRL